MAARRINQTFRNMVALQAGLNSLLEDIAGNGRQAGLELKEVLRDSAEPIREDAVRRAPIEEGDLKAAIFADRGDPSKPSVIAGVDNRRAPYAAAVEFGHAGPHAAPPHPFMRPAIEANRANVRTIIADGVARIVKKYK